MSAAILYRPQIVNNAAGVGSAWFDLPTPQLAAGGEMIIDFHHLNGVTEVTNFNPVFEGGTAEYFIRYSQESTPVFGAWEAFSAKFFDDAKPLFIQVKIKAITAGYLRHFSVGYKYNVDTPAPVQLLQPDNLHVVLPEIIRQVCEAFSPRKSYGITGTAPAFFFIYGDPEQCVNDNLKAAVYLNEISYTEQDTTVMGWNRLVEFAMGLRRLSDIEQRTGWDEMKSLIKSRFGIGATLHYYAVIIDGLKHIGTLADFGIRQPETLGDTTYQPPAPYKDCGNSWWETIIRFKHKLERIPINYG